ncbi:hypothetical protein [Chitinimonas koreensis]|uniref:hypothetical protein n=1 Tax=Chitinimonas koreensis TaxID=356302 RepID=UPI0003FB94EA|nr:hypothetical protein [Chitinimonas koreensis]QNM98368.1 hypothetical protein H9L41_09110 [Chitinimonas koreensis]
MFGIRKKEAYATVVCKGAKLDGRAVQALLIRDLDLPEIVKQVDKLEICTRVSFGRIYQKPGSLLEENDPEDQGYSARYDKITKSIGVNLRQGFMRQTLVFATREPQALCAELGLSLEVEAPPAPSEPTVS